MLSNLLIALPISLNSLAVACFSLRCMCLLSKKISIRFSTPSTVFTSLGLLSSIVSTILQSFSAQRYYLKVLQIVESGESPPSYFQSLVNRIETYQFFITTCTFGCLLMVKFSILFSVEALFTGIDTLGKQWIPTLAIFSCVGGCFLFCRPVSKACNFVDCPDHATFSINYLQLWSALILDMTTNIFLILLLVYALFQQQVAAIQRVRALSIAIIILLTPTVLALVRGALASKTQDPVIYRIMMFDIWGAVQSNLAQIFENILAFRKIWQADGNLIRNTVSTLTRSLKSPLGHRNDPVHGSVQDTRFQTSEQPTEPRTPLQSTQRTQFQQRTTVYSPIIPSPSISPSPTRNSGRLQASAFDSDTT